MNYFYQTATGFEPVPHNATELFGHSSDRFIDAFGGCCASLAILVNNLASLEPPEPLDAFNDIVGRLCDVAGTVEYPSFVEFAPEG